MTTAASGAAGRRERQREATYAEIVAASRELLAEGADLSLRAVAAKIGMTAPGLYRYVTSYQDLVDLVAFEIDKAATADFAAVAEKHPADDPAARLAAACVGFRQWALAHPREFHLCFLNPIADTSGDRRELLTTWTSGHYFTDLLFQIWEAYDYPFPALDELDPEVREAVLDPLIPAKAERVDREDRGLLWVWMRAWSALYGVLTLEVSGHCDPRVLESGALFRATLIDWLDRFNLAGERDRLVTILDEEMAR